MERRQKRLFLPDFSNPSGYEKNQLMIIGKNRKLRWFMKKSGRELGFDFWANKKVWMTMDLFFPWFERFDGEIKRKDCSVLFLLDNFSGHGRPDCLPGLSATHVEFLPLKTTFNLQPIDAGINASFKRRFIINAFWTSPCLKRVTYALCTT